MIIRKRSLGAAIFAAGFCVVLSSNSTAATTYRATLLHPAGLPGYNVSVANAVAGEFQGGVASYSTPGPGGYSHAILWRGSAEDFVNLQPPSLHSSQIHDMTATRQVGWADSHAGLWSSTAESFVDLHPAGFQSSNANGVFGDRQVGTGEPLGGRSHALIWNGTADSVVDLHPAGYTDSHGAAIYENYQVGSATFHPPGTVSEQHAALWHGVAESFVDLHPAGFVGSNAAAIWGNQQAGWGRIGFDTHALLWSGTAESVVDLNPAGFESSLVYDLLNEQQVGGGSGPAGSGIGHALLWNSSADDYVDLHPFLADLPMTIARSFATGISADGRIVGYGFKPSGEAMALLWTPVPEPTTSVYLAVALCRFRCTDSRRSFRFGG